MGITRTPMPFERDFVQIPNAWLRDTKLSRRARGLLAELMTHRAGWHITIASLQKAGPEGRDAIRGAVQELVGRGYLVRRQTQGESGRFNEIEYEISDPSTAVGFSDTGGFTDDGSADDGSADVGEPTTKKTISKNIIQSEDHQGGAGAPSPFCSNHPSGTDGRPCRRCGDARRAAAAASTAVRERPTPIPPRLSLLGANDCPEHPGYPLTAAGCDKCERIRIEDRGAA